MSLVLSFIIAVTVVVYIHVLINNLHDLWIFRENAVNGSLQMHAPQRSGLHLMSDTWDASMQMANNSM